MIGVLDVEIQAANPLMPLYPLRAYVNSPSSVRVRNIPKKIGDWNITEVQITAAYPDNSIKTANCVRIGCVWVGTIEGSTLSGKSENGFTIYANGIDENGNAVNGYVLGKGLVEILENDGTITPGQDTHYVHMLDDVPTSPKEGDLWNDDGTWYIYQDGTSYPIGDDSGLIQQLSARVDGVETALSGKADVSATVLNPIYDGNGEQFSEWTYVGLNDFETVISMTDNGDGTWTLITSEREYTDFQQTSPTLVNFDDEVTATRTENHVIGYKLGAQNDKPLQPQLSSPQISAINSVVDERATVITFDDNTTSSYNWIGEINQQTMIDAGLFDGGYQQWIKNPVRVKIGNAVTSIANSTFAYCGELADMTIPGTVTSIGNGVFEGCAALSSIMIENGVLHVGDAVFVGCENLVSVTIPDSVTSIGEYAFSYSGLTSVTIGNGLTSIGEGAFMGCSSLPEITLPTNIQSIGANAFGETSPAFHLYFTEFWATSMIPTLTNYPWGVSNTANIQNVRNATKEWVEEQGYGKDFAFAQGSVSLKPQRHIKLQPFTNTYLSLASGATAFDVRPQGTAGTTAREMYFTLVLAGPMASAMTWGTQTDNVVDKFEGGSASTIAPTTGTNVYHLVEYTAGHFSVSLFNGTYYALSAELGNKADLSSLSGYVPYVTDINGQKTAVTVGSRATSNIGQGSMTVGLQNKAPANGAFSAGAFAEANNIYTNAFGLYAIADGIASNAHGLYCKAKDTYSYVIGLKASTPYYQSHGQGTFNVNPEGGLSGFYIGEQSLGQIIGDVETLINAI